MKRILSILLTLAMLLGLTAGAAADTLTEVTCTTGGVSYDVPAEWNRRSGDENTDYFYYTNGSATGGMLMVMVQDIGLYSSLLKVLSEEQIYQQIGEGIGQGLGDSNAAVTTTLEQAGSNSGAYYHIDAGEMVLGGFAMMTENNLVAVMLLDTAMSADELHDRVIGIASTLRTGDAQTGEEFKNEKDDLKADLTDKPAADVGTDKNENLDWLFTGDEGTRDAAGEERTAYTLGSMTFTAPAAWTVDAANTNDSQISFVMDPSSTMSMLRITAQDMGDNADMLKTLDFDTVMDLLVTSLSNQFEGATAESVTYGSIPGRKMTINMFGFDASVFLTFSGRTMLIVMGMDMNAGLEQVEQAVSGVVETITWAE